MTISPRNCCLGKYPTLPHKDLHIGQMRWARSIAYFMPNMFFYGSGGEEEEEEDTFIMGHNLQNHVTTRLESSCALALALSLSLSLSLSLQAVFLCTLSFSARALMSICVLTCLNCILRRTYMRANARVHASACAC